MKTKELIAELQEADPSGDMDVTVGKTDIFFVGTRPYYWDGRYQRLIRDASNEYYNIIGAEFPNDGSHVSIRTLSIEDALLDDPEMPVECFGDVGLEAEVEKWREEMRRIHESI